MTDGISNFDVESEVTPTPLEPEMASVANASVSDKPAENDEMGYTPYVYAMSEFLSSEDTRPPLTVSIEGEGGSGKSSFMRQLRHALEMKGAVTAQFNPSRHESEGSLWAAFVVQLLTSLSQGTSAVSRFSRGLKLFRLHLSWENGFKDFIARFAVQIVLLGVFIATSFVLFTNSASWIQWQLKLTSAPIVTVSRLVTGLGGSALAFIVFMAIWSRLRDLLGGSVESDLQRHLKKPAYDGRVQFVEQFHRDFAAIVESYSNSRKIYVFIEDLDRCEPARAAELMRDINLLAESNPALVFVVALDRRKVAVGLASRLGELQGGFELIDKFVQMPFFMPKPDKQEVNQLLQYPSTGVGDMSGQSTSAFSGARHEWLDVRAGVDSEAIRQVVSVVAPGLDFNPRRLKQFINMYRLRVRIAAQTGLFDQQDGMGESACLTLEKLGKLVAMELRWPLLIADLDRDEKLLATLQEAALNPSSDWQGAPWMTKWINQPDIISFMRAGVLSDDGEPDGALLARWGLQHLDVMRVLKVAPLISRTPPAPVEVAPVVEAAPVAQEQYQEQYQQQAPVQYEAQAPVQYENQAEVPFQGQTVSPTPAATTAASVESQVVQQPSAPLTGVTPEQVANQPQASGSTADALIQNTSAIESQTATTPIEPAAVSSASTEPASSKMESTPSSVAQESIAQPLEPLPSSNLGAGAAVEPTANEAASSKEKPAEEAVPADVPVESASAEQGDVTPSASDTSAAELPAEKEDVPVVSDAIQQAQEDQMPQADTQSAQEVKDVVTEQKVKTEADTDQAKQEDVVETKADEAVEKEGEKVPAETSLSESEPKKPSVKPSDPIDKEAQLKNLGGLASQLIDAGEFKEAIGLLKKQEALCNELRNKEALNENHGMQAVVLNHLGRVEEALALLKKQEVYYRKTQDKVGLNRSYDTQATVLEGAGRTDALRVLLKKQEALYIELADKDALSKLYARQAANYEKEGQQDALRVVLKKQSSLQDELGDKEGLAKTFARQVVLYEDSGRHKELLALLEKQEMLLKELGDANGLKENYTKQTLILEGAKREDDLMSLLEKQEVLFSELGDKEGLRDTYARLSVFLKRRNQIDKLEACYRKAIEIAEALNDQPKLAAYASNISALEQERGQIDEAEQWLQRAIAVAEALGDQTNLASYYNNMSKIEQEKGRAEETENWLKKSLKISESLEDWTNLAAGCSTMIDLLLPQGESTDIETWLQKAIDVDEKLEDGPKSALPYYELSQIEQQRGQLEKAEEWLIKGLDIDESLGDASAALSSRYLNLSQIEQELSKFEEAARWLEKVIDIEEENNKAAGLADRYKTMTELEEQLGNKEEAAEWLGKAWEIIRKEPRSPSRQQTGTKLVRLLRAIDKESEARSVAVQL